MSGKPSTMGNNRIRDTRYLNQYSRQETVLERFFFTLGPKILFQHEVIPGSSQTRAQGISSLGTDEAILM